MSLAQFNIWFPAIVVTLLLAVFWDLYKLRFWRFASRIFPCIRREVLDSQPQSRAQSQDHQREVVGRLTIMARAMNLPISPTSPNSGATAIDIEGATTAFETEGATTAVDIEGQTEINAHHGATETSVVEGTGPGETIQGVDCEPVTVPVTSYFSNGTSKVVTRLAKRFYERFAKGRVKRVKSSIILQASIVIHPWVLVEIVELAKLCIRKDNRCIFQLGNWAILYYNAGKVQMHLLKEGDVPVNVEARWQDGKTGITMRGLHLTGSQGAADLDELHLPIREFNIPGEDSLIYASKVVVVDGVSLIVRSEASFILPPREKNGLIEAIWTRWLQISYSAKKMLLSKLFGVEDFQPECATNCPELEFDPGQLEISVEHWKGVRGGIQFLLGDYESALKDYDLALLNRGGHQSSVLLDCALVKCMLGRYSEAMQDVVAVITLNPNVNDIQELQACIQQILGQQRAFRIVTESGPSCQRPVMSDQEKAMVKIPDLLTGDEWHSGEIGSLRLFSDAGTAGDHGAWEMGMEPIPQVRQALGTIRNVCTMSSTVCVNKHQCKRLAHRFSAIGEGLKDLWWDRNFNVGNASDGSNHEDYPAFDELLTVLRKGEALVSSYIDSKGIISVLSRTDNRESFKEIHEELETLKAQFDFESPSELGQVSSFESSSGVERTNALAEDADQDLTEMPEDMALIKESKNITAMDMEKATLVVLEKSGLWSPRDELPSYLRIDPTAIKIEGPVRPVLLNSKRDTADELGWAAVRFGKWIGCDFAAKVFKPAAIDVTGWKSKQLLKEVGPLANLRHPHIVQLVGFGQDAEQCVFLTELMDSDLRTFIRRKLETFPVLKPRPFKRPEELDIITQIAKGINYMHTQQYAHGDLKCSNILVQNFDHYLDVKIADFGICKLKVTDFGLAKVKIVDFGSSKKLGEVWDAEAFKQASQTRCSRWTAPEAIDFYGGKEPHSELLKKSDVYSFGMICYEVVTGKYPFDGIKENELLKQIPAGVRPELPGDLDEDLKGLIKRCWDRDPNKRPEFGEIVLLLNYIRSQKPVVLNRFSSKDVVLGLMKKIPQVHGVYTELLRQCMELAIDPSHWGVKGDGGFQRSDSVLSVPKHLRIQADKLDKVRRIGMGASTTVYEATWLGGTFAMKVFNNNPSTPLNIRALQRKVDFLINLIRHPYTAQMVGLSVDSNQRCSIVMELMDGNLNDLIQSRMRKRTPVTLVEKGLLEGVVVPFELREALLIISKIALGMAFLHSKGVMHRDLKSGNVLVKEHAGSIDVKLVDFGMSLSELESQGQGSYLGVGTGFWRAPEVFPVGDSSKKPDLKAADVYSFGMTCYEVLTGKPPFSNLRRSEYTPVIEGERPTLPALLHPGLKALVEQCWHADPIKRPNFTEICEELQKTRQSLSSSIL